MRFGRIALSAVVILAILLGVDAGGRSRIREVDLSLVCDAHDDFHLDHGILPPRVESPAMLEAFTVFASEPTPPRSTPRLLAVLGTAPKTSPPDLRLS